MKLDNRKKLLRADELLVEDDPQTLRFDALFILNYPIGQTIVQVLKVLRSFKFDDPLQWQANVSGVHPFQGEHQKSQVFEADGGQSWALSVQLSQIVEGAFRVEQLGGQAVQVVRVIGEVRSGAERDAHHSQFRTVEIELGRSLGFNQEDPQVLQTKLAKDPADPR